MGLPSRTQWSPVNIDAENENGFASSIYQTSFSFFSWGNIDAHNPKGSSTFSPWNWGSSNNGEPYVSSPGAAIIYPNTIPVEMDAARMICGYPWRTPLAENFAELLENSDFINENGVIIQGENKIITMNNVRGIRVRSKINGGILFFPVTGRGSGGSWDLKTTGNYMTRVLSSESSGQTLVFDTTRVSPNGGLQRYIGLAIRPVMYT